MAAVFAALLLISIVYLTIRFCPAVRNRIDAFYRRRREERSYREAIDGPIPPEKDDSHSMSTSSTSRADSIEKQRSSVAAAKELNLPARPLSNFFSLGRNPQLHSNAAPFRYSTYSGKPTRFSWEAPNNQDSYKEVVHQQYVNPNSAGSEGPRGDGLGLGRVSVLRNHSLLRKAGYDVPPKLPGPSMTSAQAQITIAGAVRIMPGRQDVAVKEVKPPSPVRSVDPGLSLQPQEVRRKPVPAPVPVAPKAVHRVSYYEDSPSYGPTSRLHIEIPTTPTERRSQVIGMAVSSTPQSQVGRAR